MMTTTRSERALKSARHACIVHKSRSRKRTKSPPVLQTTLAAATSAIPRTRLPLCCKCVLGEGSADQGRFGFPTTGDAALLVIA